MIGLLKKPFSICQTRWKEIYNALPVIRLSLLGEWGEGGGGGGGAEKGYRSGCFADIANQD